MPEKQFNSTLCHRNADGCLIYFNSAFMGTLSFNMNTWMEPHHEARARMFTVSDANVKLKVRDGEEGTRGYTDYGLQIMDTLA